MIAYGHHKKLERHCKLVQLIYKVLSVGGKSPDVQEEGINIR